jgi:hypothetical protein
MIKNYLYLLIIPLLISCSEKFNVEYQYCDLSYKNCKPIGKFDSMSTCERVRELDSSYCDKVTTPGKIICDTTFKSTMSLSICKEIK